MYDRPNNYVICNHEKSSLFHIQVLHDITTDIQTINHLFVHKHNLIYTGVEEGSQLRGLMSWEENFSMVKKLNSMEDS